MRKKNTEQISEIIRQFLGEMHLDKPLNEKRLIDAWPEVLGQNIMKYTTDLRIYNRVLYVTLNSSVLRHDLYMSKDDIKKSLNARVGSDIISDIVFK